MGTASRLLSKGAAVLGVGVVALTGCQTYPAGFGGMTLPSPHYLKHQPQYFPPDPAFPLQRELNAMQDPEGLARSGVGAPLPTPAPGPLGQAAPSVPPLVQPPAPAGSPIAPPIGATPAVPPAGR
jgi:hypothetical protein